MDAIWTPAQVSILGEWSLENGTEVMRPELYSDMRRADAATWIPDSEMIVETLNQTGFGCLELSANGLYGMKLQEGCEEQLRPSCEYTGKLQPDMYVCMFMYVCFPLLILRSEMFPSRGRYHLTAICPRDT